MSRSRTLVVCGAGALLLAIASAVWLRGRRPSPGEHTLVLEPLPEVKASCPEERVHAAHAAHAALHNAQARMQRYAFAPGEGRLALERAAVALECARLSNDTALITATSHEHAVLHERLARDARDRFRRYQVLKRHGRLTEAASDIAFLIELGWPERGALADTLRRDRETLRGGS